MGNMIKEVIKRTGISQSLLSEFLGVSKSMVNMVQRGERELKGEASEKLSNLLIELVSMEKEEKGKRKAVHEPGEGFLKEQEEFHRAKIRDYEIKRLKIERSLDKMKLKQPKISTRLAVTARAAKDANSKIKRNDKDDLLLKLIAAKSLKQDKKYGLDQQQKLENELKMWKGYAEVHRKILRGMGVEE